MTMRILTILVYISIYANSPISVRAWTRPARVLPLACSME